MTIEAAFQKLAATFGVVREELENLSLTVIEDRPVVIVLLNSYGKRTRVADARRVRRWVEATLLAHDSTATTT